MAAARGGIIRLTVDGILFECKGDFTANIGAPKREAIIGSDGVHGFKETPQVAYIEGKFTDRGGLSITALLAMTDQTVYMQLANGKSIVLSHAWYAADGNIGTGEGEIDARFEARAGEEIAT